ncbi:MAG TPA: baseplate J/gp47 family protein [Gaiellaceae bacterium]|nr:baseplate J/gp47 family protein [Gaiellaceae bacterium]
MPFDVPSREDLFAEFMNAIQSAFPEKNTSKGSDPFRLGRVVSGAVWSVIAKLLFAEKNLFPDTARADFADRWGNIFGVPRKGATPSHGTQALAVTGVAGSPVPNGSELAHADGTLYQVASVGAVLNGGGNVTVDVVAISTGSATNKRIGDVLTFTAPPVGVDPVATLVADLVDGDDTEIDDAYVPRYSQEIADSPEGGAAKDYLDWALAVPGVATAYVWAHRRGLGTIDVAVLGAGSGAARILADLTAVVNYIAARRPAGVKDIAVLVVTPQSVDVACEIAIDDKAGFVWDWDDGGSSAFIITAFNAGTKTITLGGGLPAGLAVGDRLTISSTGEEAKITVIDVVHNILTIDAWPSVDPTVGTSFIRASGDLVVPVRTALLARYDSLGPARNTRAAIFWDDSLRIAKLLASATDVAGVVDADLTTPGANVSPSDPLPTQTTTVPLIVPGSVLVTKKAS